MLIQSSWPIVGFKRGSWAAAQSGNTVSRRRSAERMAAAYQFSMVKVPTSTTDLRALMEAFALTDLVQPLKVPHSEMV